MRRLNPILLLLALLACGCAGSLTSQISRSINHATDYLVERQSPDGTWHSQVYKDMEDGSSLTPTITKALVYGGTTKQAEQAAARGIAYVTTMVDEGGPKKPLIFPVYDAAAAVLLLARAGPEYDTSRASFLKYLRNQQLGPDTGWAPEDPQFGGWGYSTQVPYKPKQMTQWDAANDSNLSSTLFALGALRIGETGPRDPAVTAGLNFALRCQNFDSGDTPFDDGGFFASPTFGPLNKAGGAGTDNQGRTRYLSYGSATADGLRCLLRAGYSPTHPRVTAARLWLEKNFSAQQMAGEFPKQLSIDRDSLYYYWVWSLSHAMNDLQMAGSPSELNWAEPVARELLKRQLPTGSWKNPASASREDDPLVATPFAMAALSLARQQLLTRASASPTH